MFVFLFNLNVDECQSVQYLSLLWNSSTRIWYLWIIKWDVISPDYYSPAMYEKATRAMGYWWDCVNSQFDLSFQKENSIALLLKKANWSEMWWAEWIVYSRKLKHFSEFLSSFMMCMQNIFRKMGREFTRRLSLNMFFNHDSELVLSIKCFLLLNIVSQKNAFHFKAKLIPFSHWFGTIWRNKRN